ncbi:MAG TPA: cbb3-type cytochrome c oxidase subunit I, partial [Candidatus Eisenbacteria bacterium]|nr:cbb3-type cytochrome c oxidase subunit I [Candidatus Eisenbacteria bacterium]
HAPGFLADCAWLSYGRVSPAQTNALMFGFASPAAVAVALWLLCRLGRTRLALPWLITIAALFWNLGLAIGIAGILAGDSTGISGLELPRYAAPILLAAYLIFGVCALITFHQRRQLQLYVSQWFLFAALLWFPWIYSTAQALLVFDSSRGTAQTVINLWFNHNLVALWLAPIGIAAIYYFIPKLLNRPLHSRYLALFGFWCLALFGGWGGVHAGAPVPRWWNATSTAASMMMIIPIVAFAMNCHLTLAGNYGLVKQNITLRFIVFAAACYVLAGLVSVLNACPIINATVNFTWFTAAHAHLAVYGFFSLAMFGAIYYLVPRLLNREWPSTKLVTAHYWCAVSGTILYVLPLALGGILQGLAMNNPQTPFLAVVKKTLPFVGTSTLGLLLLAIGNAALLMNVTWLLGQCFRACCLTGDRPVMAAKIKTAGATA